MSRPHPIDGSGTWVERRRFIAAPGRMLYCDRDGVIIHDRNYLSDPQGVVLIDGIVEILLAVERAGLPIVIVTNQSGIGRGYFGWDDFAAVQQRMMELLQANGIAPAAVFASPHHPQAEPPYRHPDPPMRKPNSGMLIAAASLFEIDPTASLMIGDKRDDMRAAAGAGLRRGIWVGGEAVGGSEARGCLAVDTVPDVKAAVPIVHVWIADVAV